MLACLFTDLASELHAGEQAGRLADALLLASMGNADLWAHAQTALMQRAPRPYMKVLAAVQKADMLGEPCLDSVPTMVLMLVSLSSVAAGPAAVIRSGFQCCICQPLHPAELSMLPATSTMNMWLLFSDWCALWSLGASV